METHRYRIHAATALLVFLWLPSAGGATPAPVKWTLRLSNAGPVKFSNPVLANLDSTGTTLEIVLCTEGSTATGGQGQVYVINNNSTSGSVRTGWPQSMPLGIYSSPAVGDLLGNGQREIVVGSGLNALLNSQATVQAFRSDGTTLWTFTPPQGPGGVSNHVVSSPGIGDLNGDGKEDVVFGSFNQFVYALDGPTGQPLPGWPVFVRDSVWSSPAIADLDGDGQPEVIIGSDVSFSEGTPINSTAGGALWVFRRNGSNFPGFPRYLPPVGIDSSPAIGDIDGDQCPEIVVGTTQSGDNAGGRELHAYHTDGSKVNGWPVTLSGHAFTSPMLVDLTGDSVLDVVADDDDNVLYGLRGNGTTIFQTQTKNVSGNPAVIYEMAAAKMGSDNPVLVLGGYDVTLISKSGVQLSEDGTPPSGAGELSYSQNTDQAQGPAIGDLDGAGAELNIVVATGSVFSPPTDDAIVTVWKAPTPTAPPPFPLQWPMYRHDRKHTAWASPVHSCPRVAPPLTFWTLAPCRVSDSRWPGNLTYGGPPLVGGEARTLTVHGVCGVPSTASAVSLNVTITDATEGGFVVFYPGGDGNPGTSTVNFSAGRTVANNLVVPLSFEGLGHLTMEVGMPASSHVNVIVDINGYFEQPP